MRQRDREKFDGLLEDVLGALPDALRVMLDEVPVIVEDLPGDEVLRDLGMTRAEARELCGLHTGHALTERELGDAELPSEIQLYREGIVAHALGDEALGAIPWDDAESVAAVREEVRVTLLHEIGHQFGLDEEDLEGLGYG